MKDVSWGDFFIALFLAPILVLPVVAAVYLILYVGMDLSSDANMTVLRIASIITCIGEGLFIASRYRGRGEAIEYKWAWLAVAAVVAGVFIGANISGIISAESAVELMLSFYTYVAGAFIVTMLSVFLSARYVPRDPLDARRSELERSAKIEMIRR